MALDLRVVSAEAEGRVVRYEILVRASSWERTVFKRYSECLELHKVMKIRFRLSPRLQLPKFPGKKVWRQLLGRLKTQDINLRRQQLQDYFRLLEANPCAWESQYFHEFFELPESVVAEWVRYHAVKSRSSWPPTYTPSR